MKRRDPELRVDGEQDPVEPLFSAALRAELRRELGPSSANRERVRDALWSSVATGALSPAAQRVDTLLHGQALSAASGKAAATATLGSLSAKLVVAGLLVGGGATAVLLPAPAAHERPAASAPRSASHQAAAAVSQTEPAEGGGPAVHADEVQHGTVAPAAGPKRTIETPRRRASAGTRPGPTRRIAVSPSHLNTAQPEAAQEHRHLEAQSVSSTPSVEAPVQAPAAGSLTAAPPAAAPAQATPKHALAAETVLLRAASEALQRNDHATALAQLTRYAAEFPRGVMRVEAAALRAVALCSARSDQAAAVSGSFLQAHAGSPLAERVRRACLEP